MTVKRWGNGTAKSDTITTQKVKIISFPLAEFVPPPEPFPSHQEARKHLIDHGFQWEGQGQWYEKPKTQELYYTIKSGQNGFYIQVKE